MLHLDSRRHGNAQNSSNSRAAPAD
jgi:hypothetical protein